MEIIEAVALGVKHLCKTLNLELEEGDKLEKKVYGASIPVMKGDEEYHFYLYFRKNILKSVLEIYFNGHNLEEDNLSDVSKELANIVIGFAKNELNEKNNDNFVLGTPEFLGKVDSFPIEFDDSRVYKIKKHTFKVGYKKI